jgi:hypothetical protein
MKRILAGLKGSRFVVWISKVVDDILHPLRDMPVPDFNNQYDCTML